MKAVQLALLLVGASAQAPRRPYACTGSKDPAGPYPLCYKFSEDDHPEEAEVTIYSFANGKGTMDLRETIPAISCTKFPFTKSGQDISQDGCFDQKVEYCSDDDTVSVTVNISGRGDGSRKLRRLTCPAEVEVESSCTGSKDPSGPFPLCYEGSAGALGLKEDVKVKIESFAGGKGTMDLVGSGIEKITCTAKSFTKSGQDISPDISDCLPKLVTVQKVEYCSDDDTVSVTVKDTKVPIPVSATLKKATCASTVVV